MKTITIDDKKIEISDESYEAFKKQFVTKDKAILWKPTYKEKYWFIQSVGDFGNTSWDSSEYDQYLYETGNIFKTEEEAQETLDTGWVAKRKAEVKILRFIAENDLEWDWDSGENNYFIYYSVIGKTFDWDKTQDSIITTLPYFRTHTDAQKVIDAMTPELKILFGVKG